MCLEDTVVSLPIFVSIFWSPIVMFTLNLNSPCLVLLLVYNENNLTVSSICLDRTRSVTCAGFYKPDIFLIEVNEAYLNYVLLFFFRRRHADKIKKFTLDHFFEEILNFPKSKDH